MSGNSCESLLRVYYRVCVKQLRLGLCVCVCGYVYVCVGAIKNWYSCNVVMTDISSTGITRYRGFPPVKNKANFKFLAFTVFSLCL